MNDTISSTAPVVDLDTIQRIVVQPALLASDADAGGADGIDALTQMFRAEVERALRRRLACYAPQIEVDWLARPGGDHLSRRRARHRRRAPVRSALRRLGRDPARGRSLRIGRARSTGGRNR